MIIVSQPVFIKQFVDFLRNSFASSGRKKSGLIRPKGKFIYDLIDEVKTKLLQRSSGGIKGIARIFKAMDDTGDR